MSDGSVSGTFEILVSGRKFPQLLARLGELSDELTFLGAAGPYGRMFPGVQVPMNNDVIPQLQPYRDLDASRLKITGCGHFDATDYLDDDLCMAYRVPDLLLTGYQPHPGEFPLVRDDPCEVEALARVWDANGLCFLHDRQLPEQSLTKVFNNLKDVNNDRQIGNRRGRNFQEGRVSGPSRWLPSGSDLLDLHLSVPEEALRVSCTDRKDFYHQFWITEVKAESNAVGPAIPSSWLQDLRCYKDFCTRCACTRKCARHRDLHGDFLHEGEEGFWQASRPPLLVDEVYVCFRALFQGDHVGVEVATSAHEHLLAAGGLLADEERVVSCRPISDNSLCQGLVIDDYFAISREPRGCPGEASRSYECFQKSQKIYASRHILGSPGKDVIAQKRSKVIGAEINSGDEAARNGIATLGSPLSKRLSLSWLTLRSTQLSHTTDALHLCVVGGWTSMLLYRRPLMSVLARSHSLVDACSTNSSNPRLVPLPRRVANELVVLSALAPLLVSDLAAPFSQEVFSTDASDVKGAITSTTVSPSLVQTIWKSGRSKGAYTRLKTDYEQLTERLGLREDTGIEEEEDHLVSGASYGNSLRRPMAFKYDFIEVYAGSSRVTQAMDQLGYVVGPPIDIAFSDELDMRLTRVVSWISHLLVSGSLGSIMVEPVCTTFSLIRRPPLRSRDRPIGFNTACEKTKVGNILALRALFLLSVAWRYYIPGLAEQPWTSMMRFLKPWQDLQEKEGVRTTRSDSCAFGSPHQKSFCFLSVWLDPGELNRRCSRDHKRVVVEGRYTKASASYTPCLASAIASCFHAAIQARKAALLEEDEKPVRGLENQLVNTVALSSKWKKVDAWSFQTKRHINILELKSVIRLAERLVKRGQTIRVVNMVDSNVIRCAASKGRSSSRALTPFICKYGALCIAGGLYISLPFVPTRLNTSDDPTRDRAIREPSLAVGIDHLSADDIGALNAAPCLRRWASNWIRLLIGLYGFHGLPKAGAASRFYGLRWTLPHDFCVASRQLPFSRAILVKALALLSLLFRSSASSSLLSTPGS